VNATAWFAVIGAIGLAMVVMSLVLGDLLEGLFESLGIDAGGGLFSTPVVGSFLGAFGFGAVLIRTASDTGPGLAAAGGAIGGVFMGAIALWITRSLMHMETDPSVRTDDVIGKTGTVVSAIPAGGLGEVRLVHLGQPLKLSARADVAVPYGTDVVVVAVTSSSSVVVQAATDFWGDPAPLNQGE
jgi:membrane protein implicated in regulation of membrane protease activity